MIFKTILTITATSIILLSLNMTCYAEEFICQVKSVHDGNTFTCNNYTKIKIWGIKAPKVPPAVKDYVAEYNNGYKSRDFLKSYILARNLSCQYKSKIHRYIIAQCFLQYKDQKLDIARPLLEKGFAKELKEYSKGYYTNTKP